MHLALGIHIFRDPESRDAKEDRVHIAKTANFPGDLIRLIKLALAIYEYLPKPRVLLLILGLPFCELYGVLFSVLYFSNFVSCESTFVLGRDFLLKGTIFFLRRMIVAGEVLELAVLKVELLKRRIRSDQ